MNSDLISRSDALKAVDTRHEELLHDTEYRRKHCDIDLLGIKKHILAIPPANVLEPTKGDLISREALKKVIFSKSDSMEDLWDTAGVLNAINNAPTVDMNTELSVTYLKGRRQGQLEERPQGAWIETSDFDEFYGKVYKCTNCNKETLGCSCHNYCPNCGADMRGGKE